MCTPQLKKGLTVAWSEITKVKNGATESRDAVYTRMYRLDWRVHLRVLVACVATRAGIASCSVSTVVFPEESRP